MSNIYTYVDSDDGYDAMIDGMLERGIDPKHSRRLPQYAVQQNATSKQLGYARSLLGKAKITTAQRAHYSAVLDNNPTKRQASDVINALKAAR